ncbi:MAG: hypothetical protein EBR82_25565 [Caulobacteraceae bacterium]|nr:hypothetical protein [Caulobacteraceae bacterium]
MFKYILGFSAFALASCAAFFSVKGIALLFAASFWSVAIMAGTMELAKLISASYLYRYWGDINKILKKYMLGATILLMCITSLGIFGFLSDAFQRNFSQYSLNQNKIQGLKSQQGFYLSQIDFNKSKLKDLIELQKTYQASLDSAVKQDVTTTKTVEGGLFSSGKTEKITDSKLVQSREKIVTGSQQNINSLFEQISFVNKELDDLTKKNTENNQNIVQLESDNTKGEIGTFKFVADAFGLKIETAVRIFIILIVIVFDPLAVCLVIAYNSLVKNNKTDSNLEPIVVEKIVEKIVEKPVEVVKTVFNSFKKGTKKVHNPRLADPNLPENN